MNTKKLERVDSILKQMLTTKQMEAHLLDDLDYVTGELERVKSIRASQFEQLQQALDEANND